MPASTPENREKAKIKRVLKSYGERVWHACPIGNARQTPMLDIIGCAFGVPFSIEVKAPGKKPTPRQVTTMAKLRKAGVYVFMIDGDGPLADFKVFLDTCSENLNESYEDP